MTPEDWQRVRDRRVDWREADLHDLRLRFASVLLRLSQHRKAIETNDEWQTTGADRDLWAVLDEEGWHG